MSIVRLLPALLALAACASKPDSPPTQVIVVVGGDLEVATLKVSVGDVEWKGAIEKRTYDVTRIPPMRLPTSFTIWARPGAEDARFRLAVQGFSRAKDGSTRALARTEVIASFRPEETLLLPLVLAQVCAEQRCGCRDGEPCAQVCEPGPEATCAPVTRYDADGLSQVEPGEELESLDTGLGGCPRGSLASNGRCVDVDECAFVIDACQLEPRACVNLTPDQGRYECACPPGHAGTGVADDPCVACPNGDCSGVTTEEDDWP